MRGLVVCVLVGFCLRVLGEGEPTNVFFIHGANVSAQDAHVWASTMYKRLWHAGAQMEFHPIAWESDR